MAWTPILSGAIEPSDYESVESGSASPSGGAGGHSPLITNPPRPQMPSEQQVTAAINCSRIVLHSKVTCYLGTIFNTCCFNSEKHKRLFWHIGVVENRWACGCFRV